MKTLIRCALPALLVFVLGCEYKVPVSDKPTGAFEPALLGVWESVPDKDDSSKPQRMLVLRFGENEYMVAYPMDENTLYFRAYPVKVDEMTVMQTQLLGTKDGPAKDVTTPYHVLGYTVNGDRLVIRLLNAEVVKKDVASSEQLRAAITAHKNDADLFQDPATFRRVAKP